MEAVLKYLSTIAAIDETERELRRKKTGAQQRATALSRLDLAYDEAEAAWAAIPPELRQRLCPPPERLTKKQTLPPVGLTPQSLR